MRSAPSSRFSPVAFSASTRTLKSNPMRYGRPPSCKSTDLLSSFFIRLPSTQNLFAGQLPVVVFFLKWMNHEIGRLPRRIRPAVSGVRHLCRDDPRQHFVLLHPPQSRI